MLRSTLRRLSAALTAIAVVGGAASIATAGNDLVISKDVLQARPQTADQTIDPKFTGKLPVIQVPDHATKRRTARGISTARCVNARW